MSTRKTNNQMTSRRLLALLLSLSFLISVIPSMKFLQGQRVSAAANESHTVYTGDKITIVHRVGEDLLKKTVEVLYTEVDGSWQQVFCIRAASDAPEGGSLASVLLQDDAALALLKKIQFIIDHVWPDTGSYNEDYYIKQLLIWKLIYDNTSSLSSSSQQWFNGVNLDACELDAGEITEQALRVVSKAQEMWAAYCADGQPGNDEPGYYEPTYKANITNASNITYDSSKNEYSATFKVNVYEIHTNKYGGYKFHFGQISGGTIYAKDNSGNYTIPVTVDTAYTSGNEYKIVAKYSDMATVSGKKGFYISVVPNLDTVPEYIEMYGYFLDPNNPNKQSYITKYNKTEKYWENDDQSWAVATGNYELTKVIKHPDGSTAPESGISFQLYSTAYSSWDAAGAGNRWNGTTDSNGKLRFNDIPVGTYYLVQGNTPSNAYYMSPNPATITIAGGTTSYGTYNNNEKVGYLQLYKKVQTSAQAAAGTSFANLSPESGASFQVYSSAYSSYASCPSYLKTTLTTGSNGKTDVSKGLPVGTYVIHQTAASSVANIGSDTTVSITDSHTSSAPYVKELTNSAYELNIQIRKIDSSSGAVIPAAGVQFQVLDSDKTTVHKASNGTTTFTTDSNGVCNITNLNLPVGTYYLKEITAPKGYILSSSLVQFTVAKGDSLVTVNGSQLKRVDFTDRPVQISLSVKKTGEGVTGVKDTDTGYNGMVGKDFTYSNVGLADAYFDLYCDTDVRDASGTVFRKNGVGTELKKGTKVGTYKTDANGNINISGGLFLDGQTGKASYYFVEVKAPSGYILDSTPIRFDMSDTRTDMTQTVVTASTKSMSNARQKADLSFVKVSREERFDGTGTQVTVDIPLAGAVIGLYTGEPIYSAADGSLLLNQDALIEVLVSDENGQATTKADLPLGYTYYFKEIEAPENYTKSDEKFTVKAVAQNATSSKYSFSSAPIPNKPFEVEIELNLVKTGEMPTGTEKYDTEYGEATSFVYSELTLAGAEFDLYCGSDILDDEVGGTRYNKAYNGVALVKDAYIGTYTTDANGTIDITGLMVDSETHDATYYMIEKTAPEGFLLDTTPVVFEVTDAVPTQAHDIVVKENSMSNKHQKVELELVKVSREERFDGSGETVTVDVPLGGAVFGVYAAEDIYGFDTTGAKVLLAEKDTLIEVVTSDENGSAKTTVDLPLGYTYYLKELKAPTGYIASEEIYEIETKSTDSTTEKFTFASEPVPNKPFGVDISLTLIKKGEMLTGTETASSEYGDVTTFTYSELPLAGAEFELYCGSDVLDAEVGGTRYYKVFNGVELKKDALLGTYTTDENGNITVSGLMVDTLSKSATYYFKEKSAPEGFILDETPIVYELTDVVPSVDMEVIAKDNIVSNKRQSAQLSFEKVGVTYKFDAATKAYVPENVPLSDAVFGVYAREDVYGYALEEGVLTQVKLMDAGTLVEVVTTDKNGHGETVSALPLNAKFYIKELKAPEGYMLNDGEFDFETASDSNDSKTATFVFKLDKPIEDEISRACIQVNKIADNTKLPMQNVEFEVYTANGDLVETIVTDKEGKATTSFAFPYDDEITLRETKTNEHYALAGDEVIKINVPQKDLGKYGIQQVTVYNYLMSEIQIDKVCNDGTNTPMHDVTFQLWKHGEPGEEDILIAEETTDVNGHLSFYAGEGKYYMVETNLGPWEQFRVIDEPIEVECEKVGKIIHYSVSDDYSTTLVEKRSASSGALLGHCGISIKTEDETVLYFVWNQELGGYVHCDADTEGATQVLYTNDNAESDQYGTVNLLGLVPGTYIVYEVEAPEGYRNDSEAITFTIRNTSVLGVHRLYDSMKTSDIDLILGYGICAVCGISAIALFTIGGIELYDFFKRRRRYEA